MERKVQNSPPCVTQPRAKWSRHFEFLLSTIGYSVGLSNIWRFPYICLRNGGGAFFIPYFTALFLCGFPLLFLEMAIGQYGSVSPITMWKICPLFKGVGWCMVLLNASFCIYGTTFTTWILYYLANSFKAKLPWTSCDNPWNTEHCLSQFIARNESNVTFYGTGGGNFTNGSDVISDVKGISPPEEFWHHNLLEISGGMSETNGLRWQLVLCHMAGWVMMALALIKGIKSAGKVVYVTVTLPYVLLTILLVRGCTLPGSLNGILFYLTPKWNKLLEPKIWTEAFLQVFYSLPAGWGPVVAFAGYNKFQNNVKRDAAIVGITNCLTSFYGGFVIFSVIGYMALKANRPVDEVITSGPGLVFIVYPEALGSLPVPQLWSVLFFLMLLTVVYDSQFGSLECVLGSFRDEFSPWLTTRTRQRLLELSIFLVQALIGLIFCTRAGLYFFQVWDWYMAAFCVMVVAFVETFTISWIYGMGRFFKDIEVMVGSPPNIVFKGLWGVVTPVIVVVLFVYNCWTFTTPSYGDYEYPAWGNALGWTIGLVPIIPVVYHIIKALVQADGTIMQRLRRTTRSTSDWGPAERPTDNGDEATTV